MTNAVLKVSAICHVLCIVAFRLHLMEGRRGGGLLAATFLVTLSVCLSGMERDAAARSLGRCRCRLARSLLSRHEAARPTDRPRAWKPFRGTEREEKTSGKWNMLPRMTSNKRERGRRRKGPAAPMRHPHLGGWDHKKGPQQEEKELIF